MSFEHFTTGLNSISWGDLRAMVHSEARGSEDALLKLPGFSLSKEQFHYVFANVTIERLTGFLKWQYQDGTSLCDLPFDGQLYTDVSLVWGNNRVLRFDNVVPVYLMCHDATRQPHKRFQGLQDMRETLARSEEDPQGATRLVTFISYVHLASLILPGVDQLRQATREVLRLWAADNEVSFRVCDHE